MNPVVQVVALLLGLLEFLLRFLLVVPIVVLVVPFVIILAEGPEDLHRLLTPYLWKAALDGRTARG